MNPIQLRTLKPGVMPKASEWNSLVEKARRGQPSQAGFDWANGTSYKKKPNPFRQQTIFYTPVDIPAYSVFPVKVRTNSGEPFEVCEFDSSEIEDYLDGYFGTNGRFTIPKETSFYGWLIDEYHDDPVAVYGNPNVGDECGLSERAEFKADPDAQGMIITGTFSTGVYYVRKLGDLQPSEVFGKLNEYWDGTNFSNEIEINLDDGFTVNGASVLRAFPSPSLTEKIPYNTSVTCRYVKAKGAWFFFRPTEADTTVTISGNALRLTPENPQEILLNVFISEIAANETVSNLRINAVHQFGEITGANNGYMWRKFPTELIGPPQTVADSYTVQSPRWVKDVGLGSPTRMYAWGPDGGTWHIASVDFYGPIMKGSVGYLYPGNRLINGETWWSQGRDEYTGSGMSVFFTSKYDAQGNVLMGWTYSDTLGKVLGPNDSEPFEYAGVNTHGSSLAALMQTAGLEFLKPEWTCSSEFGEYQPNSLASGTIQLGSPRWVASDGRTGITPFYFTRSWNGGNGDQYERWFGRYKCEAFNETFVNISYQNIAAFPYTDYKFCLGNFGLPYGGYVSSTAPSRSESTTFTYQAGPRGGLTASLKFVRSYGGNEDWVLETTWAGKRESANYYREEGTETLNGFYRNVFGNITKSGDTWTVNGRSATVGNLTFEGDLSTTAPNVFNFQHSITLTFDQFVQGPEFQKIYVCSPEVIS